MSSDVPMVQPPSYNESMATAPPPDSGMSQPPYPMANQPPYPPQQQPPYPAQPQQPGYPPQPQQPPYPGQQQPAPYSAQQPYPAQYPAPGPANYGAAPTPGYPAPPPAQYPPQGQQYNHNTVTVISNPTVVGRPVAYAPIPTEISEDLLELEQQRPGRQCSKFKCRLITGLVIVGAIILLLIPLIAFLAVQNHHR